MIVRGLLARSLLGSRHSQFRFAEDTKVVKQAGGKPQPPAKKPTDIKDPELFTKIASKYPFGREIPEQQMLTADEMKQFEELGKKLSEFQKYQLKEVADHILSLEYPTFLHYLARNEPVVRTVIPDRELDPTQTKAFVEKLRKPQIKLVQKKKLAPPQEQTKPAKKEEKAKAPAEKAPPKGGKK